jgi:nucleotide-binding universal stress UspA family protein
LRPKLRDLEQQLASAGTTAIETHVIWSNPPAAAIAQWVRQHGCELLVLGTKGRSGLQDLLLGSVAASLSRQAPCAVLLVPPARD